MPKHLPDPRGRIMDAALVLFARFGVEGTKLADLATRAHLGKTTLYHHFPKGKATIFRAAVDRLLQSHWQSFETEVRKEPCPVTQLARYARLRIETYDRELMRWGLQQRTWDGMKPLVNEALQPYMERERVLLAELVQRGMDDGLIRVGRADTIAGILQAAFRGLTMDGKVDATARTRQAELQELAAFLEGGLLTPPAHARWREAMSNT